MKKAINAFQFLIITIGIIVISIFIIPVIFGIKPFVVLSGSMEKEIKTGSIVYVNSNIKVEDIKVGDIIAFRINNGQATHRVISINDNRTFTTKGDANQTEDLTQVKFENYMGKTIFSIPYLGYIVSNLQAHIKLVIALGILSIILVIVVNKDNKEICNKS